MGLAEAVEDLEQMIPEHRRRKARKKRDERLPDHLPRYEVTAPVATREKICATHGERKLLPESMWDRVETQEFERPKGKMRGTKYPKDACAEHPACGVVSPERPTGIVEGNKYDSSIAAEIIVGKYAYHLPLYRQQAYFADMGWTPSRSMQCNILSNSFFVVSPLLDYYRRTLQTDSAVCCDDAGLTLLYDKELPALGEDADRKQQRIHAVLKAAIEKSEPSINAKMWAYRGVNVKLNVFDFTVSRHRDGPELFFADYEGTLLGDCWHGFEAIALASEGQILRAACNAHVRRKFEDSAAYPDDRKQWMLWYGALYDIEARGKSLLVDE